MSTYLDVTLRAVLSYFTLLLLTRLMGKREVSQMTLFDYIVGITIGSIAAQLSTNTNLTWLQMVPAVVVFASLQIISSILAKKSITFRQFVNGSPTVLILKGKILDKNMSKVRLNVSELMTKLREKNAFSLADVETAILEENGQVSVQFKANKKPATPFDLNVQVPDQGLPRLLIEDGNILQESLKDMKLTRTWLMTKLGEQGVDDVSTVKLAQVDTSGNVYVDLYDDGPTENPEVTM